MRISEWSSDVCSSDLTDHRRGPYCLSAARPCGWDIEAGACAPRLCPAVAGSGAVDGGSRRLHLESSQSGRCSSGDRGDPCLHSSEERLLLKVCVSTFRSLSSPSHYK